MMQASTTSAADSLGEKLISDHRALDKLFDALLVEMNDGDPACCQASWARFEQALLNHIDAEEVFLLPNFDRVDPAEATAIRQEHATLRHLLADMGVRIELHAVKEETVRRLIAAIREHARREEAVLYKWVDQLSPDMASAMSNRLSQPDHR